MADTHDIVLLKLGVIEGKLDASMKKLDDHVALSERSYTKMCQRISLLEKWKARTIGIAVGVGSIAGIIVSWINKNGAGS